MKVGDLVKHSGKNDVVWHGVITQKKKMINEMFCVVWTFGVKGWFHAHDLEVVCK